jgi:two-component system LytT family response regulator
VHPLRVLIVDDERPSRLKIRRLLCEVDGISAIYEAPDGPAALRLIHEEQPDLVFLDIQMPGMLGIDLLRALPPDAAPFVVFVTAHDAHAVEAFDLAAADYILKPFDRERFQRALGRARTALEGRHRREDLERVLATVARPRHEATGRLMVEDRGRTIFVRADEIERLEAERNYVRIIVPPREYRLRGTLSGLEERLDPGRFVRIARGTIVNLDRVQELRPAGHGDSDVLMRSGTTVRLSRRFRDRLGAF